MTAATTPRLAPRPRRRAALIAAALLLAACGADGPPEPPARAPQGVTLSGDARLGVTAEFP
ncbi:MAG: hypothetical protein ACK4TB_17505 [Gemmobacter sp.]